MSELHFPWPEAAVLISLVRAIRVVACAQSARRESSCNCLQYSRRS